MGIFNRIIPGETWENDLWEIMKDKKATYGDMKDFIVEQKKQALRHLFNKIQEPALWQEWSEEKREGFRQAFTLLKEVNEHG